MLLGIALKLLRIAKYRLQTTVAFCKWCYTQRTFLQPHSYILEPNSNLQTVQKTGCEIYSIREVVHKRLYLELRDTMTENKFAADYAKRIAGCKKCKSKIEKGELRVAKVVPNFFHDGEGEMKQYHHPACLFETFIRARAGTKIIEEADDIQGFTDLKQEDKDLLNQLIKGMPRLIMIMLKII